MIKCVELTNICTTKLIDMATSDSTWNAKLISYVINKLVKDTQMSPSFIQKS